MTSDSVAPEHPIPASEREPDPGSRRSWWILGGGALLLIGFLLFRILSGRGPKGPAPSGRAIPIVAAAARKGDMPVTLTGLGTVTALNTVTVKSRVDGQIVRIVFQEGQFVRQGELLVEIDPRPFQVQLMQAEGQMAKDQATLKNAAMDLERFKSLARQGILSRQQLDAQTTAVNQSEATLKADRAAVESAKLNLAYCHITAPISGKVGLRQVDLGNMVRASDATGLAVIAPVQPISVVFTIPADSVQRVLLQNRKGKPLSVEAFDRDMKTRLASGSVQAIDNQVDAGTGTVRIKAIFSNEDGALFPNQFVNARLRVDTLEGVTIIPTSALQQSPQGTFVYVVKADGTVEMRLVEVQATEGDSTALRGGLAPGELVATDGLEKLKPGAKVALPKPEGQHPKSEGQRTKRNS